MPRQPIHTDHAPRPPSARIRRPCARGDTVYLSGQIPLDPATGLLVEGDIDAQARRAFDNLKAVCEAAGGSLDDVVRLGLYLTDLGDFAAVNAVMADYFDAPYPGALDDRGVRRCRAARRSRSTRSWCSTDRLTTAWRASPSPRPRSPPSAMRRCRRCRAWARASPRSSPRAAC